jgi:SAM-dependent methyltransferase
MIAKTLSFHLKHIRRDRLALTMLHHPMTATVTYYNDHAASFFADTVNVDMAELQARFLAHVPAGGLVLDAGCGSGRDSRAFMAQGYRVRAFDASPALARLASELLGQPVATRTFAHVDETACYDGIWACASLLHLREQEVPSALGRLWSSLKPEGVFYLSFKLGEGERTHNGRHFTDATETAFAGVARAARGCGVGRVLDHERPAPRPARAHWLNALIRRRTSSPAKAGHGRT